MKHSFTDALLVVTLCLVTLGTLLGFFGDKLWLFDYFSHFRIQYLFALLVLGSIFLVRACWHLAAVSAVLLILNLMVVQPHLFKTAANKNVQASESIRLAHIALLYHAPLQEKARDYMLSVDADILCVTELSEDWIPTREELNKRYPHSISGGLGAFAISLYSRFPFASKPRLVHYWPDSPTIFAEVEVEGTPVHIVAVHTYPPFNYDYSIKRNHQFDELGKAVGTLKQPRIIAGDLNVSPWSPLFKRLLKATGLIDSGVGWGMQPTWPAMIAPFWIPVDHILVSEEIDVVKRFTGPFIGSDHFPLIMDFQLNKSGPGKVAHSN